MLNIDSDDQPAIEDSLHICAFSPSIMLDFCGFDSCGSNLISSNIMTFLRAVPRP